MLKAIVAGLALTVGASVSASAQTDGLRINQIQILGSHNSYRPVPTAAQLAVIRAAGQGAAGSLAYGHPPIADQLDMGLRQLEIDPVADSRGGLFAGPHAGDPEALAILREPGAKVLHIPEIDVQTHCLTLRLCLRQVRDWSVAHPDHDLIVVLINNRDAPEPFTADSLDAVDDDIRAVFGGDVITPDRVRGDHPTLRRAAMARAWPTVAEARGKVLFVHDTGPRLTALYAQGHPNLAGRMMFGLHDETADEAAVFNIQDPRAEGDRIRRLVAQGFLVRSRADANTAEARSGDTGRLSAAAAAGAQWISTDYYPGAPDPLGLNFTVRLDQGFSQTNPRAAEAARTVPE